MFFVGTLTLLLFNPTSPAPPKPCPYDRPPYHLHPGGMHIPPGVHSQIPRTMKKLQARFERWRSKIQFRISMWLVKRVDSDPEDIYD